MKENRKQNIKLFTLILILFLGIGYAALTVNLKINGTVSVDKATWDVHFENVSITEGSVEANPAPTTNNIDTTEMTYTINFTKPGDFFEFTTDMVNDGTIDAMVELVSNKTYASNGTTEIELPGYLENKVTYEDGTTISQNQGLNHGTSEKIKVRVEFKKDITPSDLPSNGDTTVVFKFKGDFKQADENVITNPVSFATDSWKIIAKNKTSEVYKVGDEKELKLDIDEDGVDETYHIMIVNKTNCTTETSESACGFVLQFKELLNITNNSDNQMNHTATSVGGWPASALHTYLNENVYNKLPKELKNVIIDTEVISGHGSNAGETNFTSTDKLYIPTTKEVGIYSSYDTVTTETRRLDYYIEGTSAEGNAKRSKKNYGTETSNFWWLRSATMSSSTAFDYLAPSGGTGDHYGTATLAYGVLPTFRIG